jgi:addiction module RelB/DinJ family antitoxin
MMDVYCKKKYNVVQCGKREEMCNMAATKTANVTARIQPEVKESAEAILDRLGIPVSVFIDMTYRQVIMHDGVPFSVEIPQRIPTRDSMSDAEFDKMMAKGMEQAKTDDSFTVDEAFSSIRAEING